MIYDIVHVNINTRDLARSLAFYEKLGFRRIHVFGDGVEGLDPSGDPTAGMTSPEGGRTRGAVLALSDHPRAFTKIELLEHLDPPTEPAPERGMRTQGVARIALRCKGLPALQARLEAEGIEFLHPPKPVEIVGARWYTLFRDPDGTLLELVELA